MISTGSVIKFAEEEHYYVFLASINGLVYLAKILNAEKSAMIIQMKQQLENSSGRGSLSAQSKLEDLAFCFVVLTSRQFKDQIAHCCKHEKNIDDFSGIQEILKIDEADIKQIKEEIIGSNNYPKQLQEYFNNINI
ncbi:MAG: hypothetical protein AAB575_02915 [Patescibacteria group bacterium]